MEIQKEKYINPFTDFGFKRLFGEEVNKDLLLDFLNELLREQQGTITELSYLKTIQVILLTIFVANFNNVTGVR